MLHISLRAYEPPPSPSSHNPQPKTHRLRTEREPTRRIFLGVVTPGGYPYLARRQRTCSGSCISQGAERGFGYSGRSSREEWKEVQTATIAATLAENASSHGYALSNRGGKNERIECPFADALLAFLETHPRLESVRLGTGSKVLVRGRPAFDAIHHGVDNSQ